MATKRVDITGMGLVCSLGMGAEVAFDRMVAGACGIRPIDRFSAEEYAQSSGGQVPADTEDALRDLFPDDDFAGALIKGAGTEALQQAGRAVGAADPELGLVLATNFGAMETLEWCWRERVDMGTMDEDTFAMCDDFLDGIADFFGCGGPRVQLSMSCASGAAAAALAADVLRSGRATRMLAIGYDALTEYCWCGLSNLRTISTDRLRPFDVDRSGTIFSEGAAAMLLEMDGADRTLAVLAGAATNNNAFHMTAPSVRAEGSRRVMASALQDAGLESGAIEHICAHATGTRANDSTEAAALQDLFGDRLAEITVAAHKSQLGHMMGGAGLAEGIITVLAMRRGLIPPTVNHQNLDPECVLDCIPGTAREKNFSCAITNSAGIGGNNASLVLTRA
ncbi:MAG: beta-ketoacyl-[acyl-carrier-protein] synthase family protein [Lentisphaeria bacterium]|nr:beta-ketoacyl-[acyl-carrier-protein] synthase family protein [Lentisphaeria bacterium]